MEFYSADIEMFMSGWNSLYVNGIKWNGKRLKALKENDVMM
jgi:hypothetical protein